VQNFIRKAADIGKVEVRTSNISGNGTFAKETIASGEYITTLSGDPVITDPNVTDLCLKLGISGDDPLQIDDALFLILNYASKTINHSCNPNAGIRNQSDLYALKDINIDEEITYDYSITSGVNDTWAMSCGCSSEICRQTIGNILTIPLDTLSKYLELNALPDFIKSQLRKAGKLA